MRRCEGPHGCFLATLELPGSIRIQSYIPARSHHTRRFVSFNVMSKHRHPPYAPTCEFAGAVHAVDGRGGPFSTPTCLMLLSARSVESIASTHASRSKDEAARRHRILNECLIRMLFWPSRLHSLTPHRSSIFAEEFRRTVRYSNESFFKTNQRAYHLVMANMLLARFSSSPSMIESGSQSKTSTESPESSICTAHSTTSSPSSCTSFLAAEPRATGRF